jgi:hypothetical protein
VKKFKQRDDGGNYFEQATGGFLAGNYFRIPFDAVYL